MDHQLFLRYNRFADSYRVNSPNLYFFLKDCGFQRVFKGNGNRFPNPETQNMCNTFSSEMQQAKWQRQSMTKEEYRRFLEDFYKKMDFNTVDLETCELLKLITENLGIFGPFDDLTNKRIIYFNKKIDTLKASAPKPKEVSYSSALGGPSPDIQPSPAPSTNPVSMSSPPPGGNSFGLPDAEKDSKEAKKAAQAAEDARLNEIMRQQKLNSPIYITNMNPGQFYNPYTCPNYVPQGIDRSIPLPMNKRDPNYQKLKAIIDEELILANQELDYHKIDMARNHLERAAFYLKNVID